MNRYTDPKQSDVLPYHLLRMSRGIERLEPLGKLITYPKDYELNEIGEIPNCCYIVKSGRVLCMEVSFSGVQRVYNYMEPGSMFLEECMLIDYPCPILFKTMVPSQLIRIDKCDLKRALKKDIDIVMDVCESMAFKFLSSMEHIRLGPHQTASWKICKILKAFAEDYGVPYQGMIMIREKLNQQMLADLLGLNRITVTRKIKELKELGLIDYVKGRYCVCDLQKLDDYMNKMETEA
ncbi:MAG: Crp/Fnr family transcriptional regulator [Mogibacterium sp.]|nr:Crp/Fnr family transcriptional regulator [Mogibacterium sp.]